MVSILNNLKGIKRNIKLAPYTTFRIGGPAKYFYTPPHQYIGGGGIAKTIDNLVKAVRIAQELKIPYFILGGGSNLLISDEGFNGLVIKIKDLRFKIKDATITAGAGLTLAKLVDISVKGGLTGLEWAIGIPGTVGGAVRNNAGAFGQSMGDVIKSVKVLHWARIFAPGTLSRKDVVNFPSEEIATRFPARTERYVRAGRPRSSDARSETMPARPPKRFSRQAPVTIPRQNILDNKQCQFSYRDSIFKHNKDIILEVKLKLKKGDKKESKRLISQYLSRRKKTQPLGHPSAGCVFKNPAGYSAGQLIDKCGLKGKQIGGVQISQLHANFIINRGGAKARHVVKLIKFIKQKVKDTFNIALEEEIEYVP